MIGKINSDRIEGSDNPFVFEDLEDSHITETVNNLNASETYQGKLSKALQAQSNYSDNIKLRTFRMH
ncbi:MAG TPA: hypothetical protein VN704_07700 [Verrucomicrobiae bacterium]|jgi:hypothetical protein|nr:hypothetical protein [Verrucomicrobiae bacterium]